jgi:hypothetical protein
MISNTRRGQHRNPKWYRPGNFRFLIVRVSRLKFAERIFPPLGSPFSSLGFDRAAVAPAGPSLAVTPDVAGSLHVFESAARFLEGWGSTAGAITNFRGTQKGPTHREKHMIHEFCIRNRENRCIQCRDYTPRKRVCPVYRATQKQRQAAIRTAKKDFREFLSGSDELVTQQQQITKIKSRQHLTERVWKQHNTNATSRESRHIIWL